MSKGNKNNVVFVHAQDGVEEYRLRSNGMRIVLKQMSVASVVEFMVLYKSGSRNEGAGTTGSAHFFEHLMFKGTRKFDPKEGNGAKELFSRVGAALNANTWYDRTLYFECLPSQYLPLCIEFEADRMRGLKNRKCDRDSEMTVVRNEFERGQNDPSRILWTTVFSTAFREHPYHHPTIGWRSDVEGIPLERMVQFYDQHYWPNNAVAIVVGDFDKDATLSEIDRRFGRIPHSPKPIPQVYTEEPVQQGERRVEVRRPGGVPQLLIAYHVPPAADANVHPLDAMSAILGSNQETASRLYKALVETGLAANCWASNFKMRDPGMFMIGATPAPGKDLKTVEEAIYAELDKLAAEAVSEDELARVKSANLNGTVRTSDDPMRVCNLIASWEAQADWRHGAVYDELYTKVTADDIKRVAGTYFRSYNRTVGYYIPDADAPQLVEKTVAAKPAKERKHKQVRRALEPMKAPTPVEPRTTRVELPNGLRLLIMPTPGRGCVSVAAMSLAGSSVGGPANFNAVSLTADMLATGSANYSKAQIGEIFGKLGVVLDFGPEQYMSVSADVIAPADLTAYASVLADALINPTFAPQELDIVKRNRKTAMTRFNSQTGSRAWKNLNLALYPDGHPLALPTWEKALATIDDVTVDNLRAFHQQHYTPATTVISVVGDVDVEETKALFSRLFGSWKASSLAARSLIVPNVAPVARQEIVDFLPNKANVDIFLGRATELRPGVNKETYAAKIANEALGGSTLNDRLGKEVRVKQGLTYGITSSFADWSYGGAPWYITLSVNPLNVDKALGLVNNIVDDYVQNGISPQELEDKISMLSGTYIVGQRSTLSLSQALCRWELIGLGLDKFDKYVDALKAVTKEEVDAVIRKYFNPDQLVTSISGTFRR